MGTVSQYCIVRLLFVVAPAMNFICSVLLSLGTFTEDWEYIDFDMALLKLTLEPTGIISIPNNTTSYFIINLERVDGSSTGPTNSTIIPARRRGGLWKICNVLPSKWFKVLSSEICWSDIVNQSAHLRFKNIPYLFKFIKQNIFVNIFSSFFQGFHQDMIQFFLNFPQIKCLRCKLYRFIWIFDFVPKSM